MTAVGHIRLAAAPDATGVDDLGPVSPELALVDPELARRARSLLPDQYSPASFGSPPPERKAAAPASVPPLYRVEPVPSLTAVRTVGPFPRPRDETPADPYPRASPGRYALAALLLAAVGLTLVWEARVWVGGGGAIVPAPTVPVTTVPAVGPLFAWPAAPKALAYRFELSRNGRTVYVTRAQSSRLRLPTTWRYANVTLRLRPGVYRWSVRPLFRRGTTFRAGPPIVDADYVVD